MHTLPQHGDQVAQFLVSTPSPLEQSREHAGCVTDFFQLHKGEH